MEKKSIIRVEKPIYAPHSGHLYCPSLIFNTLYEAKMVKNILPKTTIRSTIVTPIGMSINRKQSRKRFELITNPVLGDNAISEKSLVDRITNLSKEIRLELVSESSFNPEEVLKSLLKENGLEQEFICVEYCYSTVLDISGSEVVNKNIGYLKII